MYGKVSRKIDNELKVHTLAVQNLPKLAKLVSLLYAKSALEVVQNSQFLKSCLFLLVKILMQLNEIASGYQIGGNGEQNELDSNSL